ncbi:cytochrome b [Idiomarina tyrosinivorans]|uniref:Cytochrome b n=1 Tax=Idiomarina tyrosinivorans TaxID=1445662 RepID=A0A432ZPR4_9GAMM|nr:cytochrome b [Idiomarina tyrosinivorans]RUO79873.1 cytochrome b [Idiomarina tyrosinivorans]
MLWRNSSQVYGLVAVLFHWLSALAIYGLFFLGWWMLTLTYYDQWYHLGPWWHKSIGVLLLLATLLRVLWKLINPSPVLEGGRWERIGARFGHLLLYLLLFVVLISGYLIPTAEGEGIAVFDSITFPPFFSGLTYDSTLIGKIHWYSAVILVILSLGHALFAIKHHWFDQRDTLLRIFAKQRRKS